MSITFINVYKLCLVTPRTPVEYTTLSYVWEKIHDGLMATTTNIAQLQISGALGKLEINSRIPRTVLDAIAFTRAMGLQYLWVDRLCIIQDNIRHLMSNCSRWLASTQMHTSLLSPRMEKTQTTVYAEVVVKRHRVYTNRCIMNIPLR